MQVYFLLLYIRFNEFHFSQQGGEGGFQCQDLYNIILSVKPHAINRYTVGYPLTTKVTYLQPSPSLVLDLVTWYKVTPNIRTIILLVINIMSNIPLMNKQTVH